MSVIPDFIEPIVGWRGWRVDNDRLMSIVHSSVQWPVREALSALCGSGYPAFQRRKHDAPHDHCTCGIYAKPTEKEARKYIEPYVTASVVGTVALWGKLREGPMGWRAEFGYPVELWLLDRGLERGVDPIVLADLYGVTVHWKRRRGAR